MEDPIFLERSRLPNIAAQFVETHVQLPGCPSPIYLQEEDRFVNVKTATESQTTMEYDFPKSELEALTYLLKNLLARSQSGERQAL